MFDGAFRVGDALAEAEDEVSTANVVRNVDKIFDVGRHGELEVAEFEKVRNPSPRYGDKQAAGWKIRTNTAIFKACPDLAVFCPNYVKFFHVIALENPASKI